MIEISQKLVAHYKSCFDAHGDTAIGFDWASENSALLRHEIMYQLIAFAKMKGLITKAQKVTLLDLGCGSAQFYDYLKCKGLEKELQYNGIDLEKTFIEKAKEKHPKIDFSVSDILEDDKPKKYDFVTINGIFTLKASNTQLEMTHFFESFIKKAWKMSKIGLAFNVMGKDLVDWEREDLYYREFSELSKFLKQNLTPHIVFRRDYGLYEFTTYLYHYVPTSLGKI